ncbi:MAG TPA: DUF4175 family protein [Planctomycetaceae bacterium]|nr:DUF4175 family protein [Planctomycetaceae bacterium]
MPTPEALARGIGLVRRRVRVTLLASGAAWLVVTGGGLIVAAGLLDRSIHLDSPTTRLALLAAIACASGLICWRYLISPFVFPISDAALAMKIEERFPRFREGLASSLQFLQTDCDPALGSPELQRQAIAETVGLARAVDMSEAVHFAPRRPVLGAAAGVLLLGTVLTCLAPADALLAAERLFLPYSASAWPRRTNLRYLSPEFAPIDPANDAPFKVVRGRKLDLLVEDRKGRLPDDVVLEYRLPDESEMREPLRHASLRDSTGTLHDVCLLSLPADRGPVWFRVVGGDDDSLPECEMQVVLAPIVEGLEVVLTPPAYTARPVERLSPGDGKVRGIVGTKVDFHARASKPLAAATLRVKDKPAGAIGLLGGGRELRGSFVLSEAGTYSYSFLLKDSEGIENPDAPRYEIEAAADAVPDVTIDQPAADATVTAVAQLPVTATAKDDLGLREMRLRFRLGDATATPDAIIPMAADLPRPQHHRGSLIWSLRGLPLSEGMRISLYAEATDWFDLGPPHVGKSPPRMLIVVSSQQKEAEIVSRQSDVLRILERAEQIQARTRAQTGDLIVQHDKAGRLKSTDLDILKRVQADQREVGELLAHPSDGAGSLVRDLLAEMHENQLPGGEIQKRLERFQRELADLRESHLNSLDETLTKAVKTSELQKTTPDPATAREQSKSLKTAGHEESVVLESVRGMLGELARWRDWQGVHDGLRELVESQERLNADTSDVSRSTLAKRFSELNPQGQADLARLAERQSQLADQVAHLKSRLHETAANSKKPDPASDASRSPNPEAAADAAAVLKSLEQADPESSMREIGGQLAENNVGQAMAKQQQLIEQLRKLDHRLTQRPESDLKSAVEKMGQAEQQLDTLRKDQEALRKQTQQMQADKSQQTAPALEKLRKEQSRVREGAEDVSRELRRLGTEESSESAGQAAEHMTQAEQQLEQQPSSDAQAEQTKAVEQLQKAQSQLRRSKREAASQLARQSAVKIADEIAALVGRQKAVLDETKRLDAERTQQSHWTRGQLRSVQTVAQLERQLQEDTGRMADRLQEAEAYAFVLRRGAEEIQAAAERLSQRLTDAKTVSLENEALSRLRNVVGALKAEAKSHEQKPPDSQAESKAGQEPGPNNEGPVPTVAQLQLLKITQQDLLRRTEDVDRQRNAATQNPEVADELQRLTREQGDLASLIERLASQFFGGADGEHKLVTPRRPK